MKLIQNTSKKYLRSTKDCKEFLETFYQRKGWKRILKCSDNVRIFSDGINLFLLSDEEILENCKSSLIEEIKLIKESVKNLWSFEYGEVYYNPLKKNYILIVVMVVGFFLNQKLKKMI